MDDLNNSTLAYRKILTFGEVGCVWWRKSRIQI